MIDIKNIQNQLKQALRSPRALLWAGSLSAAFLVLLLAGPPGAARLPMLLTVLFWAYLGPRLDVFPPLLAILLVTAGRMPAFPGQAAGLWAMNLGFAGLTLRLLRPDALSAALSGLLWASMALLLPGLAPLAFLGLFGLTGLQREHDRKVFFPAAALLLGSLALVLVQNRLPEDLTRPVLPPTYEALLALGRGLLVPPRLWSLIPMAGLFELCQGHPQELKRWTRHFFILGGLLTLLFLPSETLAGMLPSLGIPVASILLTRWTFALPPVRRLYRTKLHPPSHPLHDNLWLTWINALLAAALIWLGWNLALELFRSGEPVSFSEARLFAGRGGSALALWIESFSAATDFAPGFWNRIVSGLFFLFSVGLLVRMLVRQLDASQPAIVAGLLFLAFPLLGVHLAAAGSAAISLWFFLLGFSALSLEEDHGAWLRGGMYLALAVCLQPVWFFPALGFFLGLFEIHRPRLRSAGTGFAIGLAAGLILLLLLPGDGWRVFLPSAMPDDLRIPGLSGMLFSLFPLFTALVLLAVVFGFRRRGLFWWTLALALIPALTVHLFGTDPAASLTPLAVFGIVAFVRAPAALDVRHPAAYQNVLTCQLLLWLSLLV